MKKQILTLALLTAFSNAALAGGDCTTVVGNLIDNCSFEDVGTATAGFFGTKGGVDDGTGAQSGWLFDANAAGEALPGWADASGSTSGEFYAEVRDDTRGIGTAYAGTKFLELDTHFVGSTGETYNGGVIQHIELLAFTDYTFSFNWAKRVGSDGINDSFMVLAGTAAPLVFDPSTLSHLASGGHNWQYVTIDFTTAAAGKYQFGFSGLGDTDGFGASIDNVSLTSAVAAVPEPETYAMFLMGLGLLGFAARKQKS